MDNTQKVLITLIVVLGALLVITNVGKLTGQIYLVEPTKTTLSVNPTELCPGSNLNIEVVPGNKGSDGNVKIYSPNSARVSDVVLRECGDPGTCNPKEGRVLTESTNVGLDWQAGQYTASVTDNGPGNEEITVSFMVKTKGEC